MLQAAGMPSLVPDYDRDGKIDGLDYARAMTSEAFTIWLNEEQGFFTVGVEAYQKENENE